MGFDMFMLRKPDSSVAGYIPQEKEQPEYWRFNSRGMAGMLEIMLKADVVDDNFSAPPMTDFPPPDTISPQRAEELSDWAWWDEAVEKPATEAETRLLQPWRDERDRWRLTPSAQSGRVPAFKFCTNDGWVVTPAECEIVANGLESGVARSRGVLGLFTGIVPGRRRSGISRDEAIVWILQWAAYNRTAAEFGGYSVR